MQQEEKTQQQQIEEYEKLRQRAENAEAAETMMKLKIPQIDQVRKEVIGAYTQLIESFIREDNHLEFIIETNPDLMQIYMEDLNKYTSRYYRDHCSLATLRTLNFPFQSNKKAEMVKELDTFLQDHPWLKTTNLILLQQRLCAFFVMKIHEDSVTSTAFSVRDQMMHKLEIQETLQLE
jgi:hypothetical protein